MSVVYKIGMALRDVEESDLPIFFEHQRDPEANRLAAFPARDWDAFVTHWRAKILGNPSAGKQTIVVDDNVVGNVLAWDQDGKRFVAYWIGRKYWGQGVATAALMEYLQHEERRPLHAYVVVHNVGSVRVLEKCGFRRVGEPERGPENGANERTLGAGPDGANERTLGAGPNGANERTLGAGPDAVEELLFQLDQ